MLRTVLVGLLLVGLLLPRMGAALAGLAPGVQLVVICRGDALVTIAVGADGAPIEVETAEPVPCLTAPSPPGEAAPADWRRLALAIPRAARLAPAAPRGPDPALEPYPTRGPPPPL